LARNELLSIDQSRQQQLNPESGVAKPTLVHSGTLTNSRRHCNRARGA
jgi:hypothetical protein